MSDRRSATATLFLTRARLGLRPALPPPAVARSPLARRPPTSPARVPSLLQPGWALTLEPAARSRDAPLRPIAATAFASTALFSHGKITARQMARAAMEP